MRLLVDTHILQWLAKSPEKLSAPERSLLAREGAHLLVSAVSIWELRIKWHSFHPSGDRKGELDPAEVVEFTRRNKIELVALPAEDCAALLVPPTQHGDPFDEMLLVHAQQLGARLLTRDRRLFDHPVAWRFD